MDYILEIVNAFLAVLAEMAPWLLLGFAMAGLLHVIIPGKFVLKHLSGRGFASVLKASLLGVPLPLCSCGVIPVAASLRSRGASAGATTSFLISTPQTGVDSVLVTYSLMGPVFAVFRVLAAFVSGLFGGVLVDATGTGKPPADSESASTAKDDSPAIIRALRHGLITLPADLAKSLSVGLIIAALITVLVPRNLLGSIPGGPVVTMLAVMLLGLPIYVCATASVPIAAALMVTQGVSPGAALVFLMTGPASNAATMFTIRKMMGTRALFVYIFVVMLTALAAGLSLDGLAAMFDLTLASEAAAHAMEGVSTFQWISAVVLVVLLVRAPVMSLFRRISSRSAAAGGRTITLSLGGLSCRNCAASVQSALQAHDDVVSAEVDLKSSTATVVVADKAGGDVDTKKTAGSCCCSGSDATSGDGQACGNSASGDNANSDGDALAAELVEIVRKTGFTCELPTQ